MNIPFKVFSFWLTSLFVTLAFLSPVSLNAEPKVLKEGEKLPDSRLGDLKDLNAYFPFEVPKTKEAWEARAQLLRRQVLISQGLWPMPSKIDLKPTIHGKIDQGDYTIEKVYFQSIPGHYVTGNLYRPKNIKGKLPAILCPHGHWSNGRFYDVGEKKIRTQIVNGEERFEDGGRSPLQARCVQLARMGCIVFHYDMIAYADSQQITEHRPAFRKALDTKENWGLFSTQAELRFQNFMGVQTLSSIRSVDFVLTLPNVDPDRIAVTGASGGATQTFLLAVCDPRIAAAFPAVMVSTSMQGGCTCENSPYLRIGTGNVELAALFAPKPMGMTGADDWTIEMPTKGAPELRELYKLMGVPQNIVSKTFPQFKHNYNHVSRAVMYDFFNKHLKLGLESPILERDYKRLTAEELTVWDEKHPRPKSGDEHEREFVAWLTQDSDKQISALKPTSPEMLAEHDRVIRGAFETLIGRTVPAADTVTHKHTGKKDHGDWIEFMTLLTYEAKKESIPIIFLFPKGWNGQVILVADGEGKSGIYQEDGTPKQEYAEMVEEGYCLVAMDLLYQGESAMDGKPLKTVPMVKARWDYAGYTYGYNYPVFAKRVHDILSVISYVKNHELSPEKIHIMGTNGAGALAAAASAIAKDDIAHTMIDTKGFRFANLKSYREPDFLSGSVKYGDVPALLSLIAPRPLWVAGETKEKIDWTTCVYSANKANQALQLAPVSDWSKMLRKAEQ